METYILKKSELDGFMRMLCYYGANGTNKASNNISKNISYVNKELNNIQIKVEGASAFIIKSIRLNAKNGVKSLNGDWKEVQNFQLFYEVHFISDDTIFTIVNIDFNYFPDDTLIFDTGFMEKTEFNYCLGYETKVKIITPFKKENCIAVQDSD